jgi:DNA-binding PadR family transcriptional regulator
MILFSIWKLKENAYSIPIHEQIVALTGEEILLGSIYMPLDRLVKRGYLDSALSDSTPERGGRHKRIYHLTPEGEEALARVRELHSHMWTGVPDGLFEKE